MATVSKSAPKPAASAAKKPLKKAAKKTASAAKQAARKKTTSAPESLAKYRSMRDFERTAEPAGGTAPSESTHDSFVVQKHDASHLHYDFRLELDGVLLSWSVPKGPSLRPGERRLAVRTEDHPLEYRSFEGVIPKSEYGGGTVIVWDQGKWKADVDTKAPTPQAMLKKGHFAFTLSGEKLRGRFHLVRTNKPAGKQELWLLFKSKDVYASETSDIVSERPESVISGRTVDEVAAAPADVWHSNRAEKKTTAAAAKKTASTRKSAAKPEAAPAERQDVVEVVKRLPLPFKLTSLDKVLYPENNLRKADLVAYYAAVASFALPHLAGRPLTLVRCPNGRAQKCFFQKQANDNVPAVVQRIDVSKPGEKSNPDELYMAIHDLPGMVAMAQVGALELHTWVCHADHVEQPDQFVFDLDPDEALPWDAVVEAAFLVRAHLAKLGLDSFVKTTGGKGLHVVLPVSRKLSWDAHRDFAKAVAEGVAREQPTRYLTNMRKDLRKGKLFLDWMRNGRGATAIAPYSTRAREGATVATPISWEELESGVDPHQFDVYGVIHRLESMKTDPWREYGTTKQSVSARVLKLLRVSG